MGTSGYTRVIPRKGALALEPPQPSADWLLLSVPSCGLRKSPEPRKQGAPSRKSGEILSSQHETKNSRAELPFPPAGLP